MKNRILLAALHFHDHPFDKAGRVPSKFPNTAVKPCGNVVRADDLREYYVTSTELYL